MMGLRLSEGIHLGNFQNTFQTDLPSILDSTRLDTLIREGYIKLQDNHLQTTAEGAIRLNAVLGYLTEGMK